LQFVKQFTAATFEWKSRGERGPLGGELIRENVQKQQLRTEILLSSRFANASYLIEMK